jgi:hypothetical protein
LELLDPPLTSWDEFQRFSTILLERPRLKNIQLSANCFARVRVAILIFVGHAIQNAIRWRMKTTIIIKTFIQDFRRSIGTEPRDGPGLIEIQERLSALFRERLTVR